jgi:DNA-binding NarL/FixJ family response regulator/class 3 adenylate cyclase
VNDLPTGAVTFLFTDIEGSTALARRLRERWPDVHADHRRLLREVFAAHGGHEVDAEGDSFFVVFGSPAAALGAAAAAQRALVEHEWPEGAEVPVRMGVHTGHATVNDGRYSGLAVHRASRICSIARGGQVLVSQTTHALVHEDEPEAEGLRLLDIGERELKDFERPIRVYELVATEPATATPGGIRVLLADDERLVRAGLRMILKAEHDLEVVGEAADGLEAVEQAKRLRPDIVLMDIRMPLLDGLEATRRILVGSEPRPRVIVLTTFDLDEYVYEALRIGASGFLLKDEPEDRLVAAIRVAADGGSIFAPSVTRRLIVEFARRSSRAEPPAALAELTPRELEVLRLIAGGLSNHEIATKLVVSEHTAKTHVAHILQKLDLRDRVQAVVLAYETELVTPGSTGRREPATS